MDSHTRECSKSKPALLSIFVESIFLQSGVYNMRQACNNDWLYHEKNNHITVLIIRVNQPYFARLLQSILEPCFATILDQSYYALSSLTLLIYFIQVYQTNHNTHNTACRLYWLVHFSQVQILASRVYLSHGTRMDAPRNAWDYYQPPLVKSLIFILIDQCFNLINQSFRPLH